MPYNPKVPSLYSMELGHLNKLVRVTSLDPRLTDAQKGEIVKTINSICALLQGAQGKPLPKQ